MDLRLVCSYCKEESNIISQHNSIVALDCGHMIQCTECRDYNLEKMMRCENCCMKILNEFPPGCGPNCPRNTFTVKASALCAICGSHLRKEARCCKSTSSMKECKKKLRSKITVLVQKPSLIENPTPKDRPCSHYTLCQQCKSSITKGHRSNTTCKVCRNPDSKKRKFTLTTEDYYEPPAKVPRTLFPTTYTPATEISVTVPRSTIIDSPPRTPITEDSSPDVNDIKYTETPSSSSRFGKSGASPIWAVLNIKKGSN